MYSLSFAYQLSEIILLDNHLLLEVSDPEMPGIPLLSGVAPDGADDAQRRGWYCLLLIWLVKNTISGQLFLIQN